MNAAPGRYNLVKEALLPLHYLTKQWQAYLHSGACIPTVILDKSLNFSTAPASELKNRFIVPSIPQTAKNHKTIVSF